MLKDILTQLGSTAVVIAIAGYILKIWIAHQLERFKTQNEHQLALKLESARAEWAKDIARLNVHESYLHQRRVEIIEEMYAKMVEAELSLQNFLVSWWAHSNQEELIARGFRSNSDFSMKRGVEFCESFTEINAMLHKNALYFDDTFIEDVINAYKPFFDTILAFDETQIPVMPDEFKDVVTVGQTPRRSVINLFRTALGVNRNY